MIKTNITANVQTAQQFLKICDGFKLGCLLTEQQNPKTIGLSTLAQQSLPDAIELIKSLDIETLQILQQKIPQIEAMYKDINFTLNNGGHIYICGCGATGRLSLVLETLWRQQIKDIFQSKPIDKQQYQIWKQKVVAFMAGGDAALIKSIEDFEDHPQFAEKQLIELGFSQNDLLIGSTEGGETSWVIGAVWEATRISKLKPYILYGNTDQILIKNVERSKKFILSQKINKINCNVGHMALAGSTRMQSTTILMYAIGLALLGCDWVRENKKNKNNTNQMNWIKYANINVSQFIKYVKSIDMKMIAPLIQYQTQLYKKNSQITYHTDPFLAISILTDTTERAPTFSLNPFPNRYHPQNINKKCWCNMKITYQNETILDTQEEVTKRDWQSMFGDRQIRGLNSNYWQKYQSKVSNKIILGFSLHKSHQQKMVISHNPLTFKIITANPQIIVTFPFFKHQPNRLSQHTLLKIVLNNLSTLVMGRMNRYTSNIMTYVRPTNYKLIDRAARYVRILLKNEKLECSYQEVVRVIFQIKDIIQEDEPIVLKVIQFIKNKKIALSI